MIRVALRGMAARRARTVLTALAVVLGVAMVSGALTLTDTMRHAADSLSTSSYKGTDAVVSARTAFSVSGDDNAQKPTIASTTLDRVRAVPEVGTATGDILDQAKIVGRDGKATGQGPFFGGGIDSRAPGAGRVQPFRLRNGHWATGSDQVVIDAGTAAREHYRVGDRIKVATLGPVRTFRVTGIATFGDVDSIGKATLALFDLHSAQALFAKRGAYDNVLITARPGVNPARLRTALMAALPHGLRVQSAKANDRFGLAGLKTFVGIIRVVLLVFGGIAVLVGAFIIFNALSITVAQRARELALLRTVGASRRQVLGSVVLEAFVLGLLASVVGLVAGLGLAKGLGSLLSSLGLALPHAGMGLAARTAVVALLVGTLCTLAAAVIPAVRATRVAPVAAFRDDAERRVRLPARLVRMLASVVGRPGERIGGVAGRLARRNAMRNPGRTAATAAALTIGVTLVVLVAAVGQGLRDVSTGAVEKAVRADYVVGPTDGWSPITPAAGAAVRSVTGVRLASSITQDEARVFGTKEGVNGIDAATIGRLYRFDWREGSDASLARLGSDGALVDSTFAKTHRLHVGSRFAVTPPSGRSFKVVVRGVTVTPKLNPMQLGAINVSSAVFARAFAAQRERFTLVDAGPEAGAAMRARLAAFPDAELQTRSEFAHLQLSFIDSIMAIFYALLALAVIVSLFGIVNTLALSVLERTRELGVLRAIGMTRRQVRRMVRHESIVTALVGATMGVAAGLALAALVTTLLKDEGFRFAFPAGPIAVFAVIAVLAGIAAAILPARRAARLEPLAALQYE